LAGLEKNATLALRKESMITMYRKSSFGRTAWPGRLKRARLKIFQANLELASHAIGAAETYISLEE